MSQTLLEMAKDLVAEQVRVHHLPPEEANALLQSTHDTLRRLSQLEVTDSYPVSEEATSEIRPADWKQSIKKQAIICMECGDAFRQLSARHLRVHDLDPRSYRAKYGIPRTQPLSSRRATARRRQLAREIRPWEGSRSKRSTAAKRTQNA